MRRFVTWCLIAACVMALYIAPASAETITLDYFADKRIGVLTGSVQGPAVEARYPDASVEYFVSSSDMLSAMQAKKLDAICYDKSIIQVMQKEVSTLQFFDEPVIVEELAPLFAKSDKGRALREEYDAFTAALAEDGTLEKLQDIWLGDDESRKTVLDYENLPKTNGEVRVATYAGLVPFSYMKDNRIVGYDIDIVARFCEAKGYGLTLQDVSVDGLIPAVLSDKADMAACGLTITEERAQSVDFARPVFSSGSVMAWLDDGAAAADTAASATLDAPEGVYRTLSELSGKNIGIQTGTSFDAIVKEALPDANIVYLNNKADLINSLTSKEIDGFVVYEPVIRFSMQENDMLTFVPEYLDAFEFGYVFPKTEEGERLRGQMNEFLLKLDAEGTLQEIEDIWLSLDDSKKTLPDYKAFPADNGTLRLATEALYEPFSYILNGEVVGYDIDIVIRFCEAYGYGLRIDDMNFDAILPAVQTGKDDFGAAGITITEERAESVLFSTPNYSGGTVMAVLKAEGTAAPSFWAGLKESFHKTFIREERWRLFVEGVLTTLIITLAAIILGTALGFLLFMMCRGGSTLANAVTHFCLWLVQGMPMVVLLMILYYVIFGHVAISGLLVAIIGFTLTFGAAVFGMLKMGVGAVDRGQYEAAYALGHTNRHTFFRIILPQAIPHVLPAYQGEIVGLIKATAIVGYIAVQDLTKMGDIVRSRTYEAFFPLIAIMVIYFVLEALFSFAVSRIRLSIDPKKRRRERILKGVNIHD